MGPMARTRDCTVGGTRDNFVREKMKLSPEISVAASGPKAADCKLSRGLPGPEHASTSLCLRAMKRGSRRLLRRFSLAGRMPRNSRVSSSRSSGTAPGEWSAAAVLNTRPAPVTAGGLVFIGATDGARFRALDAKTEPLPNRDEEHRRLEDVRAGIPWAPRRLQCCGHAEALHVHDNMQKVRGSLGCGLNQNYLRNSVAPEIVHARKARRCNEGAIVEPAGFSGEAAAVGIEQKDRRGLLG